jgi:type IV pilus biogenesis protein PilP
MQRIKWCHVLPIALVACSIGTVQGGTELPPAPQELKSEAAEAPAIKPLPDTDVRGMNLGRLEAIQADTLLYEAQLAQAKALKELQNQGYDAVLGAPFNPKPVNTTKEKDEVKPAQESKSLPQIVEISGGQTLSATLQLEGGNQVRVQSGSRIPGTVWTVEKITFGEVTVRDSGNSLVSLSFAG